MWFKMRYLGMLFVSALFLMVACGSPSFPTPTPVPPGYTVAKRVFTHASTSPETGVTKGDLAPGFTLDGFQFNLSNDGAMLAHAELADISLLDFDNNLVLVNFWGTWCAPCRAEMPHMERLYNDFKDKGFTILAIDVESGIDAEIVRDFVEEFKLTFPILMDSENAATRAYKVIGFPTTFLIGPDGVIKIRISGPVAWDSPSNRKLIVDNLP